MNFLDLIGRPLKNQLIVETLEYNEIEVIYDFDRTNENLPDKYWATSRENGFLFGFDERQILEVIFIYIIPMDDFMAADKNVCKALLFPSIDAVERHAKQGNLQFKKGKSALLDIDRDWVRIDCQDYSIHYEYRNSELAIITITKVAPNAPRL